VQGFSFLLALHDAIYGLTAGVRIVVAVEEESYTYLTCPALPPAAGVAPICARQVYEDSRKGERVHICILVVESFQLTVVFVHGAYPWQFLGDSIDEINEK
jgi:hypothetical protein